MELLLSPESLAPALTQLWVVGLWTMAGLCLYAALFDRAIFDGRGRAPAHLFGPADAGLGAALVAIFCMVIVAGFRGNDVESPASLRLPDASAMILAVVINSAIFLSIIFGVLVSLYLRGIDWRACFGVRELGVAGIVGRAAILIALALPLVGAALQASRWLAGQGGESDEQEVVRFFVGSHSTGAKLAVALSATVLAPLQEEFVFRGYLYPILKRYGGPLLGLVINAALFAGIHLHLPSFAGLFVLAACLTLAYEFTGSIFVPMAMHALFNSLTVVTLLGRG